MLAEPTFIPVNCAVVDVLPCGISTEVGEIETLGLLLVRVTVTDPVWDTDGRLTVKVDMPPSCRFVLDADRLSGGEF